MRTIPVAVCLLAFLWSGMPASQEPKQESTGMEKLLEELRAAMQAKEYARALEIAATARQQSPANPGYVWYLESLAQFYRGNLDEAKQALTPLLATPADPWWRKGRFLLAKIHLKNHDYEQAEKIYATEAERLQAPARKQEIADIYIQFAQALSRQPLPQELDALPPDYGKAYLLYKKALELKPGDKLSDELSFRLGQIQWQAQSWYAATNDFANYLQSYDPQWQGWPGRPVTVPAKLTGQYREQARYLLGACLLQAGRYDEARQVFEDLLKFLEASQHADKAQWRRDALWQITRCYRLPQPPATQLPSAIASLRSYLKELPDSRYSVQAAYEIGAAYQAGGYTQEAIVAWQEFLAGQGYRVLADATKEAGQETPLEAHARLQKEATYGLGRLYFSQKFYPKAIEVWRQYTQQFPNGPQWSAAQQGILDAEYQIGEDLVAAQKYEEARAVWDKFMAQYPLDPRTPRILYVFGQIKYQLASDEKAKELAKQPRQSSLAIAALFRATLQEWEKLIAKYADSDEAQAALFMSGRICEEELAELPKALDIYRRIYRGHWYRLAQERIGLMTQKKLTLTTERIYRTDEIAQIQVQLRNIANLTIRSYRLNLAEYFRKQHCITDIERLDLSLIEPDQTWEVKTAGYGDYLPLTQDIPIAMDGPGVYAVNVSDGTLEATTLVVRSDLNLIVKSSRREVLVFVQNMRESKPAAQVSVLISDGSKIVARGETNEQGVFLQKLDELKNMAQVSVLALQGGNIASNRLSLSGLGFSEGLSPKGYIYTDRPAYRPGETVQLRAIIRDVVHGAFIVPLPAKYQFSIFDPRGRCLLTEAATLSEFGTMAKTFALSRETAVGQYRIELLREDKARSFQGYFAVRHFQLEKIRLTLKFPNFIVFRGEKLEGSFAARYYYGTPVVGKTIRYTLPDGRSFTAITDDQGLAKIGFDTTPMRPGSELIFHGSLEGEGVQVAERLFLADRGFALTVTPARSICLAGEPGEVLVAAKDFLGKPVETSLRLTAYRKVAVLPDPVLAALPWKSSIHTAVASEVKVSEQTVATDPQTGLVRVSFTLDQGGDYVFRATATDRLGNPVEGSGTLFVSDREDATRLRLFTGRQHWKVGEQATVTVHSRIEAGLALVTYEGETILGYRVVTLSPGMNPLELTVAHDHFPNFQMSVAIMANNRFYQASQAFTVERELKLQVKFDKPEYRPGEKAKAQIVATDHLGKPVKAELSLALVDEASFAAAAEQRGHIVAFFQQGALRVAALRTETSCTFRYQGTTVAVVQEFLAENLRIATPDKTIIIRDKSLAYGDRDHDKRTTTTGGESGELEPEEPKDIAGETTITKKPPTSREEIDELPELPNVVDSPDAGQDLRAVKVAGVNIRALFKEKDRPTGSKLPKKGGKDGWLKAGLVMNQELDALEQSGEIALGGKLDSQGRPRRDSEGVAWWSPALATSDQGEVVIEITMPDKTTEWRVTAIGCTVETLVGECQQAIVTRQNFFVDLKLPMMWTEGDQPRVLARIHNLSDYVGPVELVLEMNFGNKRLLQPKQTTVAAAQTTEFVFDPETVPAILNCEVTVTATVPGKELQDTVTRRLPVRPWGLEYVSHAGGQSSGDAIAFVRLPERNYLSRWMTLVIGPSMARTIMDLALDKGLRLPVAYRSDYPTFGAIPSELLACAAALEYAGQSNIEAGDYQQLLARTKSLVATVISDQRDDGGWSLSPRDSQSQPLLSARTLWALAAAKRQGIVIAPEPLAKAGHYLQDAFTKAAHQDDEAKALIQYALALVQESDFAYANRLYRQRAALSSSGLAYTVLLLAALDKPEMAAELLDLLESKKRSNRKPSLEPLWPLAGNNSWSANAVESTALVLLAFEAVRPESPLVKEGVDYLLSLRQGTSFAPYHAHGTAVAALAGYYRRAQYAHSDYQLAVLVNGKLVTTLKGTQDTPTAVLDVPPALLHRGQNKIEFQFQGQGSYTYAALLYGFSSEMDDPKCWDYPYLQERIYRHMPLEYGGKSIGISSSTLVAHAEAGQVVHVCLIVKDKPDSGQEQLPPTHSQYLVVEEPLPAGMTVLADTIRGNFSHYELSPGQLRVYYAPDQPLRSTCYEMIAYAPGTYRVLPTVIRDLHNPGNIRIAKPATIVVLPPGQRSEDPYYLNHYELFELGKRHFDDGRYQEARNYLAELLQKDPTYQQRDVARMLLWIYTEKTFYDARKVIEVFEILRERYPELYIPFSRILSIGRAYEDIREYERAYLVFQATIEASFMEESKVGGVLEDQQEFLGASDYLRRLWQDYHDSAAVAQAYFGVSQSLYAKLSRLDAVKNNLRLGHRQRKVKLPTKTEILQETIALLQEFLAFYPESTQADDAAFSLASAYMTLNQFSPAVALAHQARQRYPDSQFLSSFTYMEALGHFSLRNYAAAIEQAKIVADGESKDQALATFILGQIYHSQDNAPQAIVHYQRIAEKFPDAQAAIRFFENRWLRLPEVSQLKTGEKVSLTLEYRNIKEVQFLIYRVDLMKLYEQQKNLAGITQVHLAGITPVVALQLALGDGKDYKNLKKHVALPLTEEGAYLVIGRGDDLFTSALILVTPLQIEAQEEADSGRVWVHLTDFVTNTKPAAVQVKVIGSAIHNFVSGETDLRGIFVADNLQGKITVIARDPKNRYAFYRGETWVGPKLEPVATPLPPAKPRPSADSKPTDYNMNLDQFNREIQSENEQRLQKYMHNESEDGVQVLQTE